MKMANLAFRPRPIDILKQLPIIRKDLEDEDDGGPVGRTIAQLPTGMEAEEEEVI
jgi:hypothetical protein